MKTINFRKILTLAIALTLLIPLIACSQSTNNTPQGNSQNSSQNNSQPTEGQSAAEEVTTITLYPKDANLQSGLVKGYRGDMFARHGLALDVWAYSDEKTNAILASGGLPDVMYVSKDNLKTMIESGMVLNLEDHLDKLPNITGNETLQTALNYVREFQSADTGKLHAIPTTVGSKVLEYGVTKNMLVINWEYYKGIGAPEFKDQWELIDVMKQMVKAYPQGEDGIANFGTYLNAGSDTTYWANITQYLKWFGYEPTHLYYLLETDMVNAKYDSILSKDSKYYEGLKWYNTVLREGLMDPDSMISDRQTQKAKVDNKHAMVTSGTLQGYGGYQPIYMPNQKLYQESWNSIYGTDSMLVVNAKSKNIDAALRFINTLADPDAYLEMWGGPEGDLWSVKDGVAQVREDVVEKYFNREDYPLASGETTDLWSTPWVIDDTSYKSSYMGPDGNLRGVRLDRWKEFMDIAYNTDQMNEWRKISGYQFFVDQVMANNAYHLTSDLDYIANFASIPEDMMKLTLDSLKDVVVNASWKMVYAKTDAEFDSVWDKMVKDANDLGAQVVIDWRLADLQKAKEIRDSLSK